MGSPLSPAPEALASALEGIQRAPSAHNTQPWHVTVTGPRCFRLGWNLDRWLAVADPEGEQLAYSIGCALEAAHAAASIDYEPAPQIDLLAETGFVGDLHVKGAGNPTTSELLRRRCTNRGPYARDGIDSSVLEAIAAEAGRHPLEVAIVQDRGAMRRVADLTYAGAAAILGDDGYVGEMLEWTRLTADEEARRPDGFTPGTLRLDPVTASLLRLLRSHPRARRLALRVGMSQVMAGMQAAAVRRSGALVLLAVSAPSAATYVEAGRGLLRVWLEATRLELAVQPVHFPVSEFVRGDTLQVFGLPADRHPVALLRIGRAAMPAARALRLPLGGFCTLPAMGSAG